MMNSKINTMIYNNNIFLCYYIMSGGLLGSLTSGLSGVMDFMSHPFESIMFFVGGIILLVIVYHILEG